MSIRRKPMKRHTILVTMSVLLLAIILLPASVFGQGTPGVTGAGASAFPNGATFGGVALSGLQFGMGVFIPGDGSATGQFQATLLGTSVLGQPQEIEVEGNAANGTINVNGSRTFTGTATVNMGDGTPPLTNVPFTVTATSTSLVIILNGTTLPAATLTAGSITIQ
jgi:hypothetical protein